MAKNLITGTQRRQHARHPLRPRFLSPEDIRAHAESRPDSDDEDSDGIATELDEHGQPVNHLFNRARRIDRATDELLGLCKGIAVDGTITEGEARFLQQWIDANGEVTEQWPGRMLSQRLRTLCTENHWNERKQADLLAVVRQLIGGPAAPHAYETNYSTALPLTVPPPVIIFERRLFCLTGKFAYGTRQHCGQAIVARRGMLDDRPTTCTDYLVIGEIGSRDWIHSTHGRKIEAAVEMRNRGRPIAIVSEQHWRTFIDTTR